MFEQRLILMQQTPEEEIERRKIVAIIDEKDRFINTVRKSIGVAQKPLEVIQHLPYNPLGNYQNDYEYTI